MHWLEKWLFPPTCVISEQPCKQQDLHPDFINKWQIAADICPRCAELSPQALVCGRCLKRPPPIARTQVAFKFDEELRDLMHQYKYHQQLHLSRLFAELLVEQLDTQGIEALIPIPLHPSRLRQRGYNQALELARIISRHTGIPIVPALKRMKSTQSKTKLSADKRQLNLKQAFVYDVDCTFTQRHIALIDDVITTGATVNAAALVLQKQQPGLVVQAWALAKTLR